MVDDLDDLGLLKTRERLRGLIVVDEDNPFSRRPNEMEAGDHAGDMAVIVDDRVTSETAGEHDVTDVIHIVGKRKVDDTLALHHRGNRSRERDQTQSAV